MVGSPPHSEIEGLSLTDHMNRLALLALRSDPGARVSKGRKSGKEYPTLAVGSPNKKYWFIRTESTTLRAKGRTKSLLTNKHSVLHGKIYWCSTVDSDLSQSVS